MMATLLPLLLCQIAVVVAQTRGTSTDDLLPIVKRFKYGYINRNGQVVVRPRFDHGRSFSEGLGRFEMNGWFGFVDRTGRVAIKPRFNAASDFSDGVALVTIPDGSCELCGETVYIDKTGEIVISMKHLVGPSVRVRSFSEGLAILYSEYGQPKFPFNLPYGYIDKSGRIVIPSKFGDASDFREGLALVGKNFMRTAVGYINRQGEYVIEPRFSNAQDFQEGLAGVQILGRWGYIDRTGCVLIEPQFSDAWPFSEGYALVKVKDKYGYINKAGEMVLPPEFDFASQFSEGLAHAERGPHKGYIDKEGKFVIRLEADEYGEFRGGVAQVLVKYRVNYPMKIGYIDRTGRYIWRPQV